MTVSLLDIANKVASAEPVVPVAQPVVAGRRLFIDADMLAYFCSGNDDVPISTARRVLRGTINKFQERAAAESVVLGLTASGTLKGDRVLVPTAKPYQAHRAGTKRPKNWEALRDYMLTGAAGTVAVATDREADDLAGWFSTQHGDNAVLCSRDKDFNMIPGWHLHWTTGNLFFVPKTAYLEEHEGKLYGYGWFHHQLLQGDTADGIRGIGCFGLAPRGCGTATASKLLKHVDNALDGNRRVTELYKQAFPEDWAWELCTQASLLWIRRTRNAALWEFIPYLTRGLSSEDNWAMRVAMRGIIGHVNRLKEEARCLQNLHTPD